MFRKLVLVDRNPAVVSAFAATFSGVSGVEVSHGSMLSQKVDAWVSPTNCHGSMDGGLDLAIKQRLGTRIQTRLKAEINRVYGGFLPVGCAVVVPTSLGMPSFVISTPTMSNSAEDVSQTLNAALACCAAFQAVAIHNRTAHKPITSIALPGLGTGTGKVSPSLCADLVFTAYNLFQSDAYEDFTSVHLALERELGLTGFSSTDDAIHKRATLYRQAGLSPNVLPTGKAGTPARIQPPRPPMTVLSLRPATLEALEHGLADRTWLSPWSSSPSAHATAFCDALRSSLTTLSPSEALTLASNAARGAQTLASTTEHEILSRSALVLALTDAVRELSVDSPDPASPELLALVARLADASDLLSSSASTTEPSSADAAVARTKARLRERLASPARKTPLAAALLRQLQPSLSLLFLHDAQPALIVSAALGRTVRSLPTSDPVATPASKALVAAVICDTASALASAASHAITTPAPESREERLASLQASRRACQLLSLLPQVDRWLDDLQSETRASQGVPRVQTRRARASNPPPITPQQESTPMAQEPSKPTGIANHPVVKTLQADAVEAAWRTAGSQLVKLTRDPLVALLSRHLGEDDPAIRNKIARFLETELGTAMLASVLSLALSTMPPTAGDVPQRLAKELRVKAMAEVGDVVAEVLMGPLRQVIAFYIQDMANAPSPMAELTQGSNAFSDLKPAGVEASAEQARNG